MRQLFKYLKTAKWAVILTPILILIEVVFEILIPYMMKFLIDDGIKMQNQQLTIKYGVIMIVLALFALLFGILATRTSTIASTHLSRNLRNAQFEKIQEYSFENLDNFQTSSLITRLTMDIQMIQMAFQMVLRISFRAPAIMLFSIVSAAILGGKMAFIFVGIAPILGFGLFIIMKGAHKHFVKMFKKLDTLNLTIQENLTGVRTVKSYVREDYAIDKFDKATRDVAQNAIRAENWIVFNNPLMQFSVGISFILIGWFGARNIVYNGFQEGEFATMITYVMQVLFSLMLLSQVFLMIVISREPIIRVMEVINEVPTLVEIENPIKEVKDGSFEFKNVSFKYKKDEKGYALKNINLKVPTGSFVGVFGATGTGKTTLVQLLSRLYDTTDGEVLVGGENVNNYSLASLRKNVGIVLQNNVLFSGTIKDNIKWGKEDASDEEVIAALKKAQAYDFVFNNKEGLDTWIEQGGVNVSGGQRQRLTIARALVGNPKILILDDSTSAVDTKTDSKIRTALKNESPKMTKVVISQRLSSIEDADIIVIMDAKGINEVGNHHSLYKSNEIYRSVYDLQQRGKEVES